MDLRDQIALAILPTIYADYLAEARQGKAPYEDWREQMSWEAYKLAGAMLAARSAQVAPTTEGKDGE